MINVIELVNIAKGACAKVMEVYNSVDLGVEYKDDKSPLTLADKASHDYIVARLSEISDFPIMSEEGKQIPYEERAGWDTFWCIDPLDGTKEFIKRNGEFVINIGLVQHGRPILGVVAVPVTGVIYYSTLDGRAFKVNGGTIKKIRVRAPTDVTKLVISRSHCSEETLRKIEEEYGNYEMVSIGSALKFMLVAEGEAHVYPRYTPCMEWDSCAPQAIVEAAGGSVIDIATGEPLRYNKECLVNGGIMVRGA